MCQPIKWNSVHRNTKVWKPLCVNYKACDGMKLLLCLWAFTMCGSTRAIPKVRSPKRCGTVCTAAVELFVQLLATLLRVLLSPLSHSIQTCAQGDRTLSLGLAAFCNGPHTEHYREVRSSRSYSVFERKRQHTNWNSSSIDWSVWRVVHG